MQRITLEIRTQRALIGIETKKARAPVRHGLAAFSLEITRPELRLTTRQPEIRLDAGAAWFYLGLGSYLEFGQMLAEQGRRDAFDAVGRIAEEGDRLAAFWVPENSIPEVAAEKPDPTPPLDFGPPPAQPVQVTVLPGSVRGEFRRGEVVVRLGPKPPAGPYEPGAVRVYLRQFPAIHISVRC